MKPTNLPVAQLLHLFSDFYAVNLFMRVSSIVHATMLSYAKTWIKRRSQTMNRGSTICRHSEPI